MSELSYAEVDPDGTIVHVCQVRRADDATPDLTSIAVQAEARGRTLVEVAPGQDIAPGAFRVEDGEFIALPPEDTTAPTAP